MHDKINIFLSYARKAETFTPAQKDITQINEGKTVNQKALINLISDYERNIFHVKKAQADGIMVETNERHYTFASRHYLQNARDKINALNQENRKENDVEPAKIAEVNPGLTQKIIPFEKIKKAETLVK